MKRKRRSLVEMLWGKVDENLFQDIAIQIQQAKDVVDQTNRELNTDDDDSATEETKDATETPTTSEKDEMFKDLDIEPTGRKKKTSYF
jgi:hypothetical protein